MMGKVLLLTASFGQGHNQAALAVRDALTRQGIDTQMDDYVLWLPRPIQRLSKFALRKAVKNTPKLYGLFYHSTASISPTSPLQKRLNHLGTERMLRLLDEYQPDIVVSTFPMPNGVLSQLRELGQTNVKTGCIITDYTAHPQWVHDHTDVYFVATDDVKRQLIHFGVPNDRIQVTGIPLRSAFEPDSAEYLLNQRARLRVERELSVEIPLFLVMGGGEGILRDASAWSTITREVDAQFVFLCGQNESLYNKLKWMESEHIRVMGYAEDVHEWMAISDCLITKAGGITVSEAFAMELPMLLLPPIPGQEAENGAYAAHSGSALQIQHVTQLTTVLKELMETSGLLDQMRQAARGQARRDAASRIARELASIAGFPIQGARITGRALHSATRSD